MLYLMDWCIYWDNVLETLGYFTDVPVPPRKILWLPDKFQRWVIWAREYQKKEHGQGGNVLPFGKLINSEDEYYEWYS